MTELVNDDLIPALYHIDYLLILGVNPGFGGQSFMEETLEKMAEAHDFRVKNGLGYDIAVDGGVNEDTAKKIVATGANVLVAGSAVYGRGEIDPARVRKSIEAFLALG